MLRFGIVDIKSLTMFLQEGGLLMIKLPFYGTVCDISYTRVDERPLLKIIFSIKINKIPILQK